MTIESFIWTFSSNIRLTWNDKKVSERHIFWSWPIAIYLRCPTVWNIKGAIFGGPKKTFFFQIKLIFFLQNFTSFFSVVTEILGRDKSNYSTSHVDIVKRKEKNSDYRSTQNKNEVNTHHFCTWALYIHSRWKSNKKWKKTKFTTFFINFNEDQNYVY